MPMYEKKESTDFKAYKLALQDWALEGETTFAYRYNKLDATRNTVLCVHDDCPFRKCYILCFNRGG